MLQQQYQVFSRRPAKNSAWCSVWRTRQKRGLALWVPTLKRCTNLCYRDVAGRPARPRENEPQMPAFQAGAPRLRPCCILTYLQSDIYLLFPNVCVARPHARNTETLLRHRNGTMRTATDRESSSGARPSLRRSCPMPLLYGLLQGGVRHSPDHQWQKSRSQPWRWGRRRASCASRAARGNQRRECP